MLSRCVWSLITSSDRVRRGARVEVRSRLGLSLGLGLGTEKKALAEMMKPGGIVLYCTVAAVSIWMFLMQQFGPI